MIYNRPLKDYYIDNRRGNDDFLPFLLGRNAFNYLIEELTIKAIVLPSFICPMVVDIFKYHQVNVFFYEGLDENLSIPIDNILISLSSIKCQNQLFFLWHDYLSVIGDVPYEIYDYLEKNNIKSIVDATHSLPIKEYQSPIVIYGFRKLLNEPFGALLKLNIQNRVGENNLPYLKLWMFAWMYRTKTTLLSLFKGFDNRFFDRFLQYLSNIDRSFNFDSNSLFLYDDFKDYRILDKHRSLDYKQICLKKQRNFLRYTKSFSHLLDFTRLDISCPYGFPLLVNDNISIRKKLWDEGIHSFVLWNTLHEDIENKDNSISQYLSYSIIVLPVNHDLSIRDIDRIIGVINGR